MIFFLANYYFLFLLEYIEAFGIYQNMLHHHYSHAKLSNEFLFIHTHQDLSHMPHRYFR